MSYQNNKLLLGSLLQNAGLISIEQLQTALKTQKQYTEMKLGEILILQEGIRAKTISFFVEQWQEMVLQGKQFLLGYYLKRAYLLSEQQIETILQEQQNNQKRFGTLAVQKGWIDQKTIDFFVKSLSPKPPQIMSLSSLEEYNSSTLHLEKKYANHALILRRIFAWTGGNLHLTKAICQVFANSGVNIPAGSEMNAVDLCVENSFLRKWQVSKPAEYIRAVKQKLVNNPRCDSKLLLKEYREILLSGTKEYQNTKEQNELVLLGLVSRENNQLNISNIIYQQVFNQNFVAQELSKIQSQATTVDNLKIKSKTAPVTKKSTFVPEKVAPNSNHVQIQVHHQSEAENSHHSKPNTNIPKLLTIAGSLIALGAIASVTPLFLKMNNYYSSQLQQEQTQEQTDSDFTQEVNQFEQFCDEIDFADSIPTLSLISRLEKNQQLLEEFPDSCETALNRLRILAAPELGKKSRILEAIKHLCKIPEDSEMHLEAEVWLQHWYDSPDWGAKTKLYLDNFAKYKNFDCAAARSIQSNE